MNSCSRAPSKNGADDVAHLATGHVHKLTAQTASVVAVTASAREVDSGETVTFTAEVVPPTRAALEQVRWRVHMGGELISDETPGNYGAAVSVRVPHGRSGHSIVARAFMSIPEPYTFAAARIAGRPYGGLLETRAQLQSIMTAATPAVIERYFQPLIAVMQEYRIGEPLTQAHFLAQVGHECIDLTDMTQNGVTSSDPFEVGRGMLQITHRYNYQSFQRALGSGTDILSGRNYNRVASDPLIAARAGGWFWSMRRDAKGKYGLVDYARNDDLFGVSVLVNGWKKSQDYMPNGYADRLRHLLSAKRALRIDSGR